MSNKIIEFLKPSIIKIILFLIFPMYSYGKHVYCNIPTIKASCGAVMQAKFYPLLLVIYNYYDKIFNSYQEPLAPEEMFSELSNGNSLFLPGIIFFNIILNYLIICLIIFLIKKHKKKKNINNE